MAQLDDSYEWQPPSESELKVIEARRERNNKISSIMGQYLLKGYKMLAVTCPVCDCVLLEDRQKNKYCVGCLEVDADTKKDNPAVSEEAARSTVQESQHRHSSEEQPTHVPSHPATPSNTPTNASTPNTQQPPHPPASTSTQASPTPTSTTKTPTATTSTHRSTTNTKHSLKVCEVDLTESVSEAVEALRDKLAWATDQLTATTSVHEAQMITTLITKTCKAIAAVKEL